MAVNLARRLKLHHLRAVEAVARYESILQASRALCISQPALSKTIREVEDAVGVSLFERHSKGLRSNHFGEMVERTAQRIMAELSSLEVELDSQLQPNVGTLTIGVYPTTAVGFLPGLLVALRTAMPGIHVNLIQGPAEQLMGDLLAARVELVVGRLYNDVGDPTAFTREQLYDEPIALLARDDHPLLTEARVEQLHLDEYGLVLPSLTHRVAKEIEEALTVFQLSARSSALRTNSLGLAREIVLSTDMVAAMPSLMMAGDIMRGSIKLLPTISSAPIRPAGIIYVAGRSLSPVMDAFIGFTRNYVARLRGTVIPLKCNDSRLSSA